MSNLVSAHNGLYDPNFQADISTLMRVPKTIRVTGDTDDDFRNHVGFTNTEVPGQRMSMTVPDRILVAGQEQHVAATGPPRELQLEQAVLPPEQDDVRIQTPPRSIRLDEYMYPGIEEEEQHLKVEDDRIELSTGLPNGHISMDSSFSLQNRDTSLLTDSMSSAEELQMMRRQMSRMSRRVMALELESQQRQQRDIIIASLGLAYFVLKTLLWVHRSL